MELAYHQRLALIDNNLEISSPSQREPAPVALTRSLTQNFAAMIRLPPRRFRKALLVAWLASIGGVAAAIGPNAGGRYDPTLAVLTLTLVAVIWYTYFTYIAVWREEPTALAYQLEGVIHPGMVELNPLIENRSSRQVKLRIRVQIWLDEVEVPQPPFYDGQSDLELPSHEVFTGVVSIPRELLNPKQSKDGGIWFGFQSVKASIALRWWDDLGEEGSLGPRLYLAIPKAPSLGVVLGEENVTQHFGAIQSQFRALPKARS